MTKSPKVEKNFSPLDSLHYKLFCVLLKSNNIFKTNEKKIHDMCRVHEVSKKNLDF